MLKFKNHIPAFLVSLLFPVLLSGQVRDGDFLFLSKESLKKLQVKNIKIKGSKSFENFCEQNLELVHLSNFHYRDMDSQGFNLLSFSNGSLDCGLLFREKYWNADHNKPPFTIGMDSANQFAITYIYENGRLRGLASRLGAGSMNITAAYSYKNGLLVAAITKSETWLHVPPYSTTETVFKEDSLFYDSSGKLKFFISLIGNYWTLPRVHDTIFAIYHNNIPLGFLREKDFRKPQIIDIQKEIIKNYLTIIGNSFKVDNQKEVIKNFIRVKDGDLKIENLKIDDYLRKNSLSKPKYLIIEVSDFDYLPFYLGDE